MSASNDDGGQTSLSKARSLDEVAEYWDEHSLADRWEATHDVEVEVRASRRHRISLDPDVFGDIRSEAKLRGIATETLVNLWLKERLEEIASGRP